MGLNALKEEISFRKAKLSKDQFIGKISDEKEKQTESARWLSGSRFLIYIRGLFVGDVVK